MSFPVCPRCLMGHELCRCSSSESVCSPDANQTDRAMASSEVLGRSPSREHFRMQLFATALKENGYSHSAFKLAERAVLAFDKLFPANNVSELRQ